MRKWSGILVAALFLALFNPPSVVAGDVFGTVSNISIDKTSVAANSAVTISFDVSLTETPTASYNYFAYIFATTDENGDSWTQEQWSSSATLVSGNQVRGHWSATVQIAASAYTGSYIASVGLPTKLFTSSGGVGLNIAGSPMPTPLSGSIGGISVSTTSLTAGNSYDFYFDVQLNVLPTTPVLFFGSISAKRDEMSGDPWTPESWGNKAILVSGNAQTGRYKVTISIPSSAYTGEYIFYANQGSTKLITWSTVNVTISGVPFSPPAPPTPPKYTFSQQSLTPSTVASGKSVSATFHLLSDDPMVQTPECAIDGVANFIYATLTNGGRMDGDWQCSISIPSSTSPGRYDFHIVVVGYANKMKNEERVILPVTVVSAVVNTPTPTPTPIPAPVADNHVYFTTTDVNSGSSLNGDSGGGNLPFQISQSPLGRFYIPAGSGTVIVTVAGAGLVSQSASISGGGMAFVVQRNPNAPLNLFLFANGLRGVSTISFNVSGVISTKSVSFGNLGDVAPAPTPTPSATKSAEPTPTPSATKSAEPTPTPSATKSAEPTPTPSATKSAEPTPTPSATKLTESTPTPSPKPTTTKTVEPTPSASSTRSVASTMTPRATPTPAKSSSPTPAKPTPLAKSPTPTPSPTKVVLKTITITCINGKVTKKITAVKPTCPTGYKQK